MEANEISTPIEEVFNALKSIPLEMLFVRLTYLQYMLVLKSNTGIYNLKLENKMPER